jgi:hypothetical protein
MAVSRKHNKAFAWQQFNAVAHRLLAAHAAMTTRDAPKRIGSQFGIVVLHSYN